MNKTSMKYSCYKEYLHRNYIITNVSLQSKTPGNSISYATTHSAFIFPIEGTALISFDDKKFLARPGYVIHGSADHQLTFDVLKEQPFTHLNIYYTGDLFWEGNSDWMNTLYAMPIKDNQTVSKLLDTLLQGTHSKSWDNFFQQEILAKQMILHLFGQSSNHDADYQIFLAAEYIQQHYTEHITLDSLARRFRMDQTRFSYLFAKYFHIRPIDYLIRFRLRKSVEFLSKGYSVSETSESVGYQDALYFSRLFKKHYGFAPSHLKHRTDCDAGKEQYVSTSKSDIILL